MTASLFEAIEAPKLKPSPIPAKEKKETCPVCREPYGRPDAKGKYFYQRQWDGEQKIPKEDRALLRQITLLPWERFEAIAKLVGEWRRASDDERTDYDSAMGRL